MFRKCSSVRSRRRKAQRAQARRYTCGHPGVEQLEGRDCPSVFYDFNIIVQTGGELTSIQPAASINDAGKVAFVASTGSGQSIYVGDAQTSPQLISFPSATSTRTYGQELQINNSGKVAAVDRETNGSGTGWMARIWDTNNPGDHTNVIAQAFSPAIGGDNFDALGTFTTISNDGQQAFAGFETYDGGFEDPRDRDWELHLSSSFVDARDLFSDPVPGYGSEVTTLPPSGAFFRFMAADGERVVVGSRDSATGPKRIVWYDITGNDTAETIATTADGTWRDLGVRPGISDDGQIVTFFGDLTPTGATSLATTSGPGIFASIRTATGRVIQRIAGVTGNGQLDPGETFTDSNNNGLYDTGEVDLGPFASFEVDSRVGVNATQAIQHAVTVVYVGTDSFGHKGIYTNRLNFFGTGTGAFDSANPSSFMVGLPILVVEQGETIPGLGPVTNLSIHDPVNNRDRGDIAFWAEAGGSLAVVRARYQEVIYLDFNPVSTFQLSPVTQALFGKLGISAATLASPFAGNMAEVFEILGMGNRPDLTGATDAIQNDIVNLVQASFDDVDPVTPGNQGVNVKVFGRVGEMPPADGPFMRVYIGDGPVASGSLASGTAGIAPGDIFNQDKLNELTTDLNNNGFIGDYVSVQDTPLIFIDNLFRSPNFFYDAKAGTSRADYFTDPSGNFVGLNQTSGAGTITRSQVENAIASTIAHEVGHALGLRHQVTNRNDLLMNATVDYNEPWYDPDNNGQYDVGEVFIDRNGNGVHDTRLGVDEMRYLGAFGNEAVQLTTSENFFPGDQENAGGRLAFAVGSDIDAGTISRDSPSSAVIARDTGFEVSLRASLGVTSFSVAQAVLGVIPNGDEHAMPELADLGSGDLDTLLDRKLKLRPGDQVFLVASTDGTGIDVFSTDHGFPGDVGSIDLTNPLLVFLDQRIRGDTVSPTGRPLALSLDLYRNTQAGPQVVGTLGSPDAPTNQTPLAVNDSAIALHAVTVTIDVLANDTDADGTIDPTTVVSANPTNGIVNVNATTGAITYTPIAGFIGTDTFTYTVKDNDGAISNEATVTVTVVPVVWYVDDTAVGAQTGLSWSDAYTDLQSALSAAAAGDEVWVAAGTYQPTAGADRGVSFVLKEGVALYGGFAGIETLRGDRDWVANVTTLSGDIGVAGDSADNSYHVVYAEYLTAGAVLDGFTVTAGHAIDGGGMYNNSGSPTLTNVSFTANLAIENGGGMYNAGGSPKLTNVTFADNVTHYDSGGGMYSYGAPTLTDVTFSGNSAMFSGGGLYNSGSATLTNVTFAGNTGSAVGGGGMFSTGSPTLTNVYLYSNRSYAAGGGMYISSGSPRLTNVWITANSALSGGGVYNAYGSPVLNKVTIELNDASLFSGGGMVNNSGSPALTNVVFAGNSAKEDGGGMANYSGSPTFTNVTFSANSAGTSGGAISSRTGSTATLKNSIIWGNTAPRSAQISGPAVVSYSIVQGGWIGRGNRNANPYFVDALDPYLRPYSSAIDAGTSAGAPSDDRDGLPRPVDGNADGVAAWDMGAYELQAVSRPDLVDDSDTGRSNEDNLTADWTPTFAGTAPAGAAVEIWDGPLLLGSTRADSGGLWSFAPDGMVSGVHRIFARGTDTSGNDLAHSPALAVLMDCWAPRLAVTSPLRPVNWTNATRVALAGTSEPGALITLQFVDYSGASAGPLYTRANALGRWAMAGIDLSALADGWVRCEVHATDAAGNDTLVSGGTTKSVQMRLGLTTNPANSRVRQVAPPLVVQMLDAYGNPVPVARQAVTLTLTDVTGTEVPRPLWRGPTGTWTNAAGRAVFTGLAVSRAGAYRWRLDSPAGAFPPLFSDWFTVS